MNRAATTALDLFYGFYQGLPVNVFLLPPRAAEIKAVATGGGAVVIGDYSSGLQPLNLEFSLSSRQSLFSVGK